MLLFTRQDREQTNSKDFYFVKLPGYLKTQGNGESIIFIPLYNSPALFGFCCKLYFSTKEVLNFIS